MSKPVLSDLDFGSVSRVLGLPQATASGHPVTYDQWLAAQEGMAWKDDVDAASVGNLNLAAPGATIDGVTMTTGMRFLAKDQTTGADNGIYVWNGASTVATRASDMNASAEFNSAIVPVRAGSANGGTQWRQTASNPTLGTTAIVFVTFSSGAPAASESAAGIAEIATQAEVDAGTDDARFITPLKLKTSPLLLRKVSTLIGDGSATQFTVTHNLNSRDVHVAVYRASGAYDEVLVDQEHTTVNAVTIRFASAPAANAFRVVVVG